MSLCINRHVSVCLSVYLGISISLSVFISPSICLSVSQSLLSRPPTHNRPVLARLQMPALHQTSIRVERVAMRLVTRYIPLKPPLQEINFSRRHDFSVPFAQVPLIQVDTTPRLDQAALLSSLVVSSAGAASTDIK